MDTSTAQRIDLPPLTPVTIDAAAALADPPVTDSMVDLSAWLNRAAPLVLDVLLVTDVDATLTGAAYFGWDASLNKAVYLGPVQRGDALTLKASRAAAEPVELVAGIYSHIGIGGGTLSAGNLTIHVRAIEVSL